MATTSASTHFANGKNAFQVSNFKFAVACFDKAIALDPSQWIVYDCRSAAYEKLGNLKNAMADAIRVVEMARAKWQGYARASRLFLIIGKHESSLAMANLALERVKQGDHKRRAELEDLRSRVRREGGYVLDIHRRRGSRAAPFRAMPVELIVKVFEDVTNHRPWRIVGLSHVCRQWRAIALNTPRFWRTLVVSIKKSAGAKVRVWHERSRGTIEHLSVDGTAMIPFVKAARKLPSDAFKHCRTMWLYGCASFLEDVGDQLVKLEEITAFCSHTEDSWPIHRLKAAPLRSLRLVNARPNWRWFTENITTLVHLDLEIGAPTGRSDPNILHALAANPLLETLIVSNCDLSPPWTSMTVTLPKLSRLEIGLVDSPAGLLKTLSVRSLRILSLHAAHSSLDPVFDDLLRQRIDLVDLQMHSCPMSARALIRYLRTATSLHTLRLTNVIGVANAVVEALLNHPTERIGTQDAPSARVMCPSLERLNMSSCTDVRTGSLVRLVKSRWSSSRQEVEASHKTAAIFSLQIDGLEFERDTEALAWLKNAVPEFSCRPPRSFP